MWMLLILSLEAHPLCALWLCAPLPHHTVASIDPLNTRGSAKPFVLATMVYSLCNALSWCHSLHWYGEMCDVLHSHGMTYCIVMRVACGPGYGLIHHITGTLCTGKLVLDVNAYTDHMFACVGCLC